MEQEVASSEGKWDDTGGEQIKAMVVGSAFEESGGGTIGRMARPKHGSVVTVQIIFRHFKPSSVFLPPFYMPTDDSFAYLLGSTFHKNYGCCRGDYEI